MIDDNKVVLKTTAIKLKSFGYEVLMAEDGASAIRQVRDVAPDLILLDLNFPPDVGHGGGVPWDGLMLLSWLRRITALQTTPVMVITGGDLAPFQDRCAEAGVLDVFLKPIDHEALGQAIHWALDEDVAEPRPAPVEPPPVAEPPPAAEPPPVPAFDPAAARKPDANGKVLLVDHEEDWRSCVAACLAAQGYEVVTVEDPIQALLEVSNLKPDVVVLGLDESGAGGTALLRMLIEVHPEVPVLACAGDELDNAQVVELRMQGASNCLRKRSVEELLIAVQGAIGGLQAPVISSPVPSACRGTQSQTGMPDSSELSLQEIPSAPEPAGAVPAEAGDAATESILVIESDAAAADALRSFLEPQSFRVTVVARGAEAVRLVTAGEVDIILFDLTLPDLRVQEFYRAVEAAKPHLCPRIIYMISDQSHPTDDGFVRRIKGVSIWKPFPMELLGEALQSVRAGAPQARLAAAALTTV